MPTLGVDTLPSQRVPQKILKKSISLYYTAASLICSVASCQGFLPSASGQTISEYIKQYPICVTHIPSHMETVISLPLPNTPSWQCVMCD